jgi:hypothetical protein
MLKKSGAKITGKIRKFNSSMIGKYFPGGIFNLLFIEELSKSPSIAPTANAKPTNGSESATPRPVPKTIATKVPSIVFLSPNSLCPHRYAPKSTGCVLGKSILIGATNGAQKAGRNLIIKVIGYTFKFAFR